MSPKPSTRLNSPQLGLLLRPIPSNQHEIHPNQQTTLHHHNLTQNPPIPIITVVNQVSEGKKKAIEGEVEEVAEVVMHEGIKRTLFREYMVHATATGLDKLRLTKRERILVNRVFQYGIHGGRFYHVPWYGKIETLRFFPDFLNFQEWEKVCQFSEPVYPIEVIQFYASVYLKDRVLHAVVNGLDVTISLADFCTLFSVPDDGMEINPSAEWGGVTEEEKLVIKRYFDDSAMGTSNVMVESFSPKLKFFFNFLWNTIVTRKGGRDKISSYEMVMVYSWLEGKRVSLSLVVFHRIIQTSFSVTKEKVSTTLDLPYGMWISRLLEVKRVVNPASYGVIGKDEMCHKYFKLMKIWVVGPDLVFQAKGVIGEKPSDVLVAVDKKLDSFMASVVDKMETQATVLAELVSGLGQGSKGAESKADGISNDDVVAYMRGVEGRIKIMERSLNDVCHEVICHGHRMDNLVSQGGALMKDGRSMREKVATVLEATKALSMKVLNFDTCLTAQANYVRSCFDRLDSLKYRTRPGYVNPNTVNRDIP